MLNNDDLLILQGVFKIKRDAGKQRCVSMRNYDSISMRIDGGATFFSEGETMVVREKDLLYVPKEVVYRQETEGETLLAIHFFNHSKFSFDKIKKITIEEDSPIVNSIIEMYQVWNEKKPGYKYKCTATLYELIYALINLDAEAAGQLKPENRQLNAAVDYIHTHYRRDRISVAELAKMSSMSESYFRRVFKSVYSVSPNRYITNLRLEYASQLLKTQLYTVAEVSEQAGFNDTKYFERVFKRNFSEGPKKHMKT